MALPFPGERLVMEPRDLPKTGRPRQASDVLPLFVALEDLHRSRRALIDASMLQDRPHAKLYLYYIWYVKRDHRANAEPLVACVSCGRTLEVTGASG